MRPLSFVFGIAFGTICSAMIVSAWTGPTLTAPNGNVNAPINVGSTPQIKNGSFGVNSLAVYGDTILSGSNLYLNFGATTGTSGYGIRDNNGTLEFKSTGGSWASVATVVQNALALNGITINGLGQVTQIKFADGTTQNTSYAILACSMSATPSSISNGSPSTLSWSSSNAVSAALSGVGTVATSGVLVVNPSVNTTYTLTVTSINAQTATCQTGVAVSPHIYSGVHNAGQCTTAAGNVQSIGGVESLCVFTGASCPTGWTYLANWNSTASRTCAGSDQCSTSCAAPVHAFSNAAIGACYYIAWGSSTNGGGPCGSTSGAFCYAQMSTVGCY